MPTPFYHIQVALDLLHHPDLPHELGQRLEANRCSFLFGNTAPDVQLVSGQPREATHFFNLPIPTGQLPAWETFLHSNPSLLSLQLSEAHKAFLCGYLCHLQADWYWQQDIFGPVFGPTSVWDTFRRRLFLHNVLRTYLDLRIFAELPAVTGECLMGVNPKGWLPFVQDADLNAWKDILSQQFQPGASPRTVEVFAERQKISPDEYYRLILSEEQMQHEIFTHISLAELQSFRDNLIVQNLQLIRYYYSGDWDQHTGRPDDWSRFSGGDTYETHRFNPGA